MKGKNKYGLLALTITVVLAVTVFVATADTWDLTPGSGKGYVNPDGSDTNVSILKFNCSNTSATGNTLNNFTINLTINSAATGNVSDVDLYDGATVFSENLTAQWDSNNQTVINISQTITGQTNFTLNFTLDSGIPDGTLIDGKVVANTTQENVTCGSFPKQNTTENVTVDITAPTITVNNPANTTNSTSTAEVINISVTDGGSGLDNTTVYWALNNASACGGTYFNSTNDTNVAFASVAMQLSNSTASVYNTTLDTSALDDGNYYLCFKGNDTPDQGPAEEGTNNSILLTIDNTNPGLSLSVSDTSITTSGSTTISCTCSDDTSGCRSSTGSITITKPNGNTESHTSGNTWEPDAGSGDYTVSCATVDDYANNTATAPSDETITVSSAGGGGGGISEPSKSHTWDISAGVLSTKDFDEEIGIPEVGIKTSKDVDGAELKVTKLADKPKDVSKPAGIAAQYYDFESNIDDADITDGTYIEFEVDSTWISDNSINESTITLMRYKDGSWTELETELVEGTTRYSAGTPGFSYFAVTGEKEGAAPSEEPTEEEAGMSIWWIVGIVAAVLAVAAILYFVTAKKKKR